MAIKNLGEISIKLNTGFNRGPAETDDEFKERIKRAVARAVKTQLAGSWLYMVEYAPPKYYGTQPNPLPPKLAAGVQGVMNGPDAPDAPRRWQAKTEVVLTGSVDGRDAYLGTWDEMGGEELEGAHGSIHASFIDWATAILEQWQEPKGPEPSFEEQAALAREAFAESEKLGAELAPFIGPLPSGSWVENPKPVMGIEEINYGLIRPGNRRRHHGPT